MNTADLLPRFKRYLGEDDAEQYPDALLLDLLEDAAAEILSRLYPYHDIKTRELPVRYRRKTLEIAVYLLNRMGVEGQDVHSESGIRREYESAGIPESMLIDIVPLVGCS